MFLYFVSSRERPWRHSAHQTCQRINASKRIICASIPGFLFERVRKQRSYARNNKRVIMYHALTSRSFSRWDKVYTIMQGCCFIDVRDQRSYFQTTILKWQILYFYLIIVRTWCVSEIVNVLFIPVFVITLWLGK